MNPTELMQLPIFQPFELSELDILAGVLREERHEADTILFHRSGPARNCVFIIEGEVEVKLPVGQRRLEVVAVAGRGEILGEIAVLDGGKRSATCVVGPEGCRLAVLDKSDFDLLFNAGTPLGCKLLRLIAGRVVKRLRGATAFLVDSLGGVPAGENLS